MTRTIPVPTSSRTGARIPYRLMRRWFLGALAFLTACGGTAADADVAGGTTAIPTPGDRGRVVADRAQPEVLTVETIGAVYRVLVAVVPHPTLGYPLILPGEEGT